MTAEEMICAKCQDEMTPRGLVLARAKQMTKTQTEITEAIHPDFHLIVFAADDDFETNSLRVALWITRTEGGNKFAIGSRIPFRELSVNSDFSARIGKELDLLVSEVYKHTIREGEAISYITERHAPANS